VTVTLVWATHPLLLLINILAAFRITRLVVADAFPLGEQRARFRDWANQRWGPYRRTYAPEPDDTEPTARDARLLQVFDGDAPLAYLLTCYWCAGLYVSVLVALLASTGTWWLWLAVPLALSAAIGLLAALD
jgi:hypothetical protein